MKGALTVPEKAPSNRKIALNGAKRQGNSEKSPNAGCVIFALPVFGYRTGMNLLRQDSRTAALPFLRMFGISVPVKRIIIILARMAGWLLITAITVLSLVPPGLRPETPVPHDFEHAAIFAATGFVFGVGYYHRLKSVAAGLIVFAAAIELAQTIVPGRHARLEDFIVDALAMVIAVTIGAFVMLYAVIPLIERESSKGATSKPR
jgi:VanZ family protein